uniref:Stromal cell derived factor 2 n=1 Tax=Chelonoidis abingdonii TaxID=106734 RepID=A0A8C0GLR0_CHEAB
MRRWRVPGPRLLILVVGLGAAAGSEPGPVTCGSVVKLLNVRHNVRLHSHDVRYGSGSGQQSVTGVSAVDDSNSYWRVRGKTSMVCERGTPVQCGQSIRLTHINTGRNLHSHHFTSPLSGNQEVSAFGEDGEGDYLDDWTVLCSGTYWVRDGEGSTAVGFLPAEGLRETLPPQKKQEGGTFNDLCLSSCTESVPIVTALSVYRVDILLPL